MFDHWTLLYNRKRQKQTTVQQDALFDITTTIQKNNLENFTSIGRHAHSQTFLN